MSAVICADDTLDLPHFLESSFYKSPVNIG